jgi:hypothetical protein
MYPRFSLLLLASASLLLAIDADRDFSGKWIIAEGARLSVPFDDILAIEQTDTEIRCTAGSAQWTYALNGTERKVQIGGEMRNSVVKWEGAALLINTIVSGAHDYVVMDRWRLSRDHATLTVTRQIIRGVKQEEGSMTYRRDRPAAPRPSVITADDGPPPELRPLRRTDPPPPPAPAPPPVSTPPPSAPALARRETAPPAAPPLPAEVIIPAGTHIPLRFRNTVDTRHAHEGDRIYLQTAFPVAQDGRIILPQGTFVTGAVTQVKQAGHMSKGELFIRFDTVTLPNGKARDLRSSLATDEKGRLDGEPGSGGNAGNVGSAAGTGARVGVMTGSAAGHAGMGAGIGASAAGIASVLLAKGADASLPQGTAVDMVLDHDLRLKAEELR